MDTELPLGVGQIPIREEPSCLLREFFNLNEYDRGTIAMGPQIRATQNEIKASVINMLSFFYDFGIEDSYKHLDEFLNVCGIMRISHIDNITLRLRLFHLSLKEKVKHYLKSMTSIVRITI